MDDGDPGAERSLPRSLALVTDAHPSEPALDLALTHALLREVAAGERPATARLFRPGPTLAFGRHDALAAGYFAAATAGRRHGYVPAVRLGGGRAVAYDRGSVQFDLLLPQESGTRGTDVRFALVEGLLSETFRTLGVDVRRGELPGEYCPGRFSMHAGAVKVAGSAQRVVRGAALVTAVVLVEGGQRLRDVLTDVYRDLALDWRPSTGGALEEVDERIDARGVLDALGATLAQHSDVRSVRLGPGSLPAARRLLPLHALDDAASPTPTTSASTAS